MTSTRMERSQAQVDAYECGEGELHVDVHTENYSPCTDVILSSSHTKQLALFKSEFRPWTE